MWTSKYSGSRVIVAKIADIGPPGAPQYFFQKKNLERSNYCTPRLMSTNVIPTETYINVTVAQKEQRGRS